MCSQEAPVTLSLSEQSDAFGGDPVSTGELKALLRVEVPLASLNTAKPLTGNQNELRFAA